MSFFEERQKMAERKFQHDEELRFKAFAKAARVLGHWIAPQLGLSGDAAETYAHSLVTQDMSKSAVDSTINRVLADFKAKGVEMSEHRIRKEIESIVKQVREEMTKS
jgi:hypothetical protein